MSTSQKSYTPKSSNNLGSKGRAFLFPVLVLVLIFLFFASLFLGSTTIEPISAIKDFLTGNTSSVDFRILFHLRLPRVLGAIFAGGALAVSGAVIQAVLGNPMASPSTIGVNAGSGLGAIIFIAIFPTAITFLPLAAFLGGILTAILIYLIAVKTNCSKLSIILVGIAVSSTLTAAISLVKTLFPDAAYDWTVFSVGSLSGLYISDLFPAAYIIIGVIILLVFLTRGIDVLSLGENTARTLGMRVKTMQFVLLSLAALLAGSAVSFAGLLGFVGLIVPHIGRRIVGVRHKMLIPFCALFGGITVLLSDLLARIIFAPYEIAVGIILSFLGCPFFIFLILNKKGGKEI